jgi:hypothetical protein
MRLMSGRVNSFPIVALTAKSPLLFSSLPGLLEPVANPSREWSGESFVGHCSTNLRERSKLH